MKGFTIASPARRARAMSVLFVLAFAAALSVFNSNAAAQQEQSRGRGRVVISDSQTLAAANENDLQGGDLQFVSSEPIGARARFSVFAPTVVDPLAFYSNVTTFLGIGTRNGGSGVVGTNTITRLVADDLTLGRPATITGYRFSVANFNGVAVSARPLVRFYNADGPGGGPGTLLGGNNFNAISFPSGQVSIFTASPLATPITTFGKTWAGITFDNNSGATGATAAQLDNLGQGNYNPPDVGTSADIYFVTTANGSFAASNPAGSLLNSASIDNFGWELLTNAPTAATVSIGGRVTAGASGEGVSGATVRMTDAAGAVRTARTNRGGFYSFNDVPVGETYIFAARAKRFEFPTQVLNVTENTDGLNFNGF